MAKRAVRIRDIGLIRMVSDPVISPCGCRVAFVHSQADFEKDEYVSDIWLADLASGEARQLTAGRGKDKTPRWGPDGGGLLFTSTPSAANGEKKRTQIYVLPLNGGEAQAITDVEGGASCPAWSPKGRRILFLGNYRDGKPESDVKVIDRLEYRFNGKGYYDGRRSHLFTVPAKGGKAKQLTRGDHDVAAADWVDEDMIVFIGNMEPDADREKEKFLYLIPTKGGEAEKLTSKPMSIGEVKASPGGEWIAFSGHDNRYGQATKNDIYIVKRSGGEPVKLTEDVNQDLSNHLSCDIRSGSTLGSFDWSPSGEWIYFQTTSDGVAHLHRVKMTGGSVEHLVGEPDHSVEAFTLGPDGAVAYTVLKTAEPIELWALADGKRRQVTELNREYLRKVEVQSHERFTFKSSAGHTVEGWIMKPHGWKEGAKYPAVLEIHGGPRGAYGNGFMHEFQVLAAEGYGVFYVNPWGSGGYTQEYQKDLPGHYGEQDYRDLMEATDYVAKNYPWVDEKRIGVLGGSYGGFMTNWIVTHTPRFKAAVTMRSICNWVSMFGTSDIGWHFCKWEVAGLPWKDEEQYMSKSPIRYVENVKTPTLILHSEEDWRCPSEQGEQFFVALKCLGVPTRLVKFPGENHDLSRGGKPKHREERLKHIIAWFKEYL